MDGDHVPGTDHPNSASAPPGELADNSGPVGPRPTPRLPDTLAPGSKRVYRAAWKRWNAWCVEHQVDPLDPTPEDCAAYLDAYHRPAMIDQEKAGIRAYLDSIDRADVLYAPVVRRTVRAIRKRRPPVKQMKPLRIEHLQRIIQLFDLDYIGDLRDRAIILIGWCGGLRRGDISGMSWGNIQFVPEGVWIDLKRRKRRTEDGPIAVPFAQRPALCGARALRAWSDALNGPMPADDPAIVADPVWCQVQKGGNVHRQKGLTPSGVGKLIRDLLTRIGLGHDYSAHSLRAGLISSALEGHCPSWVIQRTTGHATVKDVLRYQRQANPWTWHPIRYAGL